MILAAGFGSRLRPLTERCAKPLVPVGDRPALAHLIDQLRAAHVAKIVVNVHYRAEQLRAFAAGRDIVLSEEQELLGTAGGIARASSLLGQGDSLVWNADIVADINLSALLMAHRMTTPLATLVVHPRPAGDGSVGTDEHGRIIRLRRTRVADRVQHEVAGGDFLGVSILSAELRARLPMRGCLIGDVCLAAVRNGETLSAFVWDGPWHDIGSPAGYLRANLGWLDARGLACWRGPDAAVAEDVTVERAVIGQGASVDGCGAVTRCVVWPGARAIAPLGDVIVTPDFVVGTSIRAPAT